MLKLHFLLIIIGLRALVLVTLWYDQPCLPFGQMDMRLVFNWRMGNLKAQLFKIDFKEVFSIFMYFLF